MLTMNQRPKEESENGGNTNTYHGKKRPRKGKWDSKREDDNWPRVKYDRARKMGDEKVIEEERERTSLSGALK